MSSASRKVSAKRTRRAGSVDLSRLVRYEEVANGSWFRVGSGDSRVGDVGQVIGIVSLKHGSDYSVVLRLADGAVDSFAPMQLFPAKADDISVVGRTVQLPLVL